MADAAEARAQERHRQQMTEFSQHEDRMVEAFGELNADFRRHAESIELVNERLADMGHEIRAHTATVLGLLDRFGPRSE
jgi:hypothetical protein